MTLQKYLQLQIEHLTDSLKSLSEDKGRMLIKSMNASDKASNAKTPEKKREHLLNVFKFNLERECIEVKLKVIQNQLDEIIDLFISQAV